MPGSFGVRQHAEDIDLILKGELTQYHIFAIDVGAVTSTPQDLPLMADGNALIVLPRVYQKDLGELVSSTVARIYVQVNENRSGFLPMSMIANSSDLLALNGPVIKGKYMVTIADAGKKIYCAVLKSFGVAGGVGAPNANGYQSPGGTPAA